MQHLIAKINYCNYFITYANWFHCFYWNNSSLRKGMVLQWISAVSLCVLLQQSKVVGGKSSSLIIFLGVCNSGLGFFKAKTWISLNTTNRRKNLLKTIRLFLEFSLPYLYSFIGSCPHYIKYFLFFIS